MLWNFWFHIDVPLVAEKGVGYIALEPARLYPPYGSRLLQWLQWHGDGSIGEQMAKYSSKKLVVEERWHLGSCNTSHNILGFSWKHGTFSHRFGVRLLWVLLIRLFCRND